MTLTPLAAQTNESLTGLSLPASGPSARKAKDLAEDAARSARALAADNVRTVAADIVELSAAAQQPPPEAQGSRSLAQPTIDPRKAFASSANNAGHANPAVQGNQQQNPPTFTQSDVDRILQAYGAAQGQTAYDPAFDFNNDGRIDFSDLNFVLSNVSQQAPGLTPPPQAAPPVANPSVADASRAPDAPPANNDGVNATPNPSADGAKFNRQDLNALLSSFGRTKADEGYNPDFDLNGDGRVGFDDLNTLLGNFGQHVAAHSQQDLNNLLASYGARAGEPNYNPAFDYSNKGYVGFADLNTLLDRLFTA